MPISILRSQENIRLFPSYIQASLSVIFADHLFFEGNTIVKLTDNLRYSINLRGGFTTRLKFVN